MQKLDDYGIIFTYGEKQNKSSSSGSDEWFKKSFVQFGQAQLI